MKNSADFEKFLRQDAKRVAQSIPSIERISDAQAAKIRAVTAQLDTRREMPTFVFDPTALPTMDAIRFVVGKNPNMPLSRALVKTAGNAVTYPKISFAESAAHPQEAFPLPTSYSLPSGVRPKEAPRNTSRRLGEIGDAVGNYRRTAILEMLPQTTEPATFRRTTVTEDQDAIGKVSGLLRAARSSFRLGDRIETGGVIIHQVFPTASMSEMTEEDMGAAIAMPELRVQHWPRTVFGWDPYLIELAPGTVPERERERINRSFAQSTRDGLIAVSHEGTARYVSGHPGLLLEVGKTHHEAVNLAKSALRLAASTSDLTIWSAIGDPSFRLTMADLAVLAKASWGLFTQTNLNLSQRDVDGVVSSLSRNGLLSFV